MTNIIKNNSSKKYRVLIDTSLIKSSSFIKKNMRQLILDKYIYKI